jgi:hypothetical protein
MSVSYSSSTSRRENEIRTGRAKAASANMLVRVLTPLEIDGPEVDIPRRRFLAPSWLLWDPDRSPPARILVVVLVAFISTSAGPSYIPPLKVDY